MGLAPLGKVRKSNLKLPVRPYDGRQQRSARWHLETRVLLYGGCRNQGAEACLGRAPNGYIVLTSEGRWIVVQTAEGRKAPQTDEERAAAFRSMLAYSGKYRTEGNKIFIKVDIAADEIRNGTEQVRYFRLEGDRLHIEAAPQPYANFGQGNARHPNLGKRLVGSLRCPLCANRRHCPHTPSLN